MNMSLIHLRRYWRWLGAVALVLIGTPAWAADAKIIFSSDRGGDPSKIYLMTPDGAVAGPIGALPGGHADPKFSPDNTKIAFTYYAPNAPSGQIYIMNADGSGARALTSPPNSNSDPQFTRAGRIVYTHELQPGSVTPPFTALYTMDADGSHQAPLSFNIAGYIEHVSVGFNGLAVFTGRFMPGDNHESAQIYTTALDGSGLRRLTDSPDTFSMPAWSADGGKIAYANRGTESMLFSNIVPRHDQDGIYVMNADGSGATRLVRIDFSKEFGPPTSFGVGPGREVASMCGPPSFSPDGALVTYAVNVGEKCQIYVVNRDGTGLRQLTRPPTGNGAPSFSH
jgi:Tol biopolymer transport system component